jgi:hypothetical protein
LPRVGRDDTRYDLAESALSRPIFTHDPVALAPSQVEANAIERQDAGEALADLAHRKDDVG